MIVSRHQLTELLPEDIISKSKDLVKNDVVRGYYRDRLSQLTEEILIKGGSTSPIERFLIDKFNAEIGYCNMALFKAGIGITQELKGLVETGRKHIEKYESDLLKNREDFQERVAGILRAE